MYSLSPTPLSPVHPQVHDWRMSPWNHALPSASCDSPQPRFFRQLMAQGHSPEGVYLPVKQAITEENEDANKGHAEGDGFRQLTNEDSQSRLLHSLPWAPPAGGRRRLLGLGDVQYPLDGYFLSKSGLYYVQVQLGWQRQLVNLQVDTGSDLLWTRCVCPSCPPPHPSTNHTQQPAGGQQSPSAPSPAPPSGPSPSTPPSGPPVAPPSSASLNRATNMAANAGTSADPGQGLLAGAQMALEVDGSQRPAHTQAQAQAQAQPEGDARRVVTAAGAGNAVNTGAYAGGGGAGGVGREAEWWDEGREEERWDEEAGQLAVPRGWLMRGAAEGGADWPVAAESVAGQQRHSLAAVGGVRTSRRCQYMLQYGDGSTTAGDLLFDSIALRSTSKNSANATIAFGCGVHQTGRLASDSSTASLSGVMGLGRGPLSIVTQLAAQGVLHESFSLCLEGRQRGGHLVLGRRRLPVTNATVTAPLAPSDDLTVYRLPLLALYLNWAPIPLPNGTTTITVAPTPHGLSTPASGASSFMEGDGAAADTGEGGGGAGDSGGGW
ncbi:unnamed protein product [Closterium sp. Yama58-4]|nr:unnamed protein product [Closterium sp. Yama58-4]